MDPIIGLLARRAAEMAATALITHGLIETQHTNQVVELIVGAVSLVFLIYRSVQLKKRDLELR